MPRYAKHLIALALVAAGFAVLYRDVVVKLVHDWGTDDNYSHGFLIVPIALYLMWERRGRLAEAVPRPSNLGLVVVLGSVAVLGAGILGAELFLTRISILGVLTGVVLFLYGWQYLRILAFPLGFLLLMIPIPAIVFNQIAFPLQLLASRFGELGLMIAGVPVLREGNVITLANTSLEVAEACSGIRSLISLLTLAIVYGYVIERRNWARVALALASIPVAIAANGVRVAGTGIAAHYVGPEAAQGFFHEFSGWLVFIVAFLMLFAVQRAIAWLAPDRAPRTVSQPADRDKSAFPPSLSELRRDKSASPASPVELRRDKPASVGGYRAIIVALVLVLSAVAIGRASKSEAPPPRESLATFPMDLAEWRGQSADRFDQQILAVLGVDEYVNRIYTAPTNIAVGLYLGYYRSQREGDTMHSPLNCLPGAGWQPVKQERVTIPVATTVDAATGQPSGRREIVVNRFIIQRGLDKQVVIYWYQSHGRVVASEYWGKIYTVVDAIRLNRTDAAMVRVICPVSGGDAAAEERAEQAATAFTRAMFPLLGRYLPD
jgi:exosortase D (VPLPA-CTERM-specific)